MNLQLSTRKEVASFFGVTTETVYNWEKKEIIHPYCKVNGRPRYNLQDVIEVMAQKKGGEICVK